MLDWNRDGSPDVEGSGGTGSRRGKGGTMSLERRSKAILLLLAAAAAATAGGSLPRAQAGDDMPGKWYENRLVGFHFRPLNEWAAVPPGTDPDDPKVCGFYSDAAKYDRSVKPECSVYAFRVPKGEGVATLGPGNGEGGGDKKPEPPRTPEEARKAAMDSLRLKGTREAIEQIRMRYSDATERFLSTMDEKKQKKMREKFKNTPLAEKDVKTDDGILKIYDGCIGVPLTNGEVLEVHTLGGAIRNEEYEVGVIYEVPGPEWKKYGPGAMASLKTMEFLGGEDIAAARKDLEDALVGKTGDERWLEEIKRKVGPGWAYLQTRNYLLVYDKVVKPDRVRLIAVQIEAIRKDVYEVLFPPDRPVTAISVVRVCKDKEQYSAYGGPGGSAGYWNSADQELVFYEDTQAKKDALRVLNHEAFHQFIFYSVGSISPHDWFNEGHGDYFAGHNYNQSGRFVPKPFTWRTSEIKGAIGSKKYIPLKTFVRYSHQQYYGPLIGQNYAQGWSLIWFLRQQRNPEWQNILPTYFSVLKTEVSKWVDEQIEAKKKDGSYKDGWKPSDVPGDIEDAARNRALDAAFPPDQWNDARWEKFENAWKKFDF
jgi:hypothetical protein